MDFAERGNPNMWTSSSSTSQNSGGSWSGEDIAGWAGVANEPQQLTLAEVLTRLPESRLKELRDNWKKLSATISGRLKELTDAGIQSTERSAGPLSMLDKLSKSAELSLQLFELALEAAPLNPQKQAFKDIVAQIENTMQQQSVLAYELSAAS